MSNVTLFQRLYLGAVAVLALWVGIWCSFFPAMSDSAIPWRLPPLCATLFGSLYLSGALFTATCMCMTRWTDIRVVMPMIVVWTGGLTIISLFYLPTFDFARTQVLTWFGAYIVYPLIALGLMWTHRRGDSLPAAHVSALPAWIRWYLLIQSGVMVIVALALLVAPEIMLRLWPWATGRMMLQLYAAPFLSYGIGGFILRRQRAWSQIRLALIAMGVFTGLEFVESLRYRSFLNGPTLAIAAWLAWLAVMTIMLAILSWMGRAGRTAGAQAPRSAMVRTS